MSKSSSIQKVVPEYVQGYFLKHLPSSRLYHNYDHAKEVAEVSADLAQKANLSDTDSEILQIAAWFHDSGYTKGDENLGKNSAAIAAEFLKEQAYPEEQTREVIQLIEAIHGNEPPEGRKAQMLYDANISFTGRKRFFRRGKLLRIEKERVEDKKFTLLEWNKYLLDLLINHQFFTQWAHNRFSNRRNKNIAKQRKNIHGAYKKTTRKKTGKEFGRAVDTLYRITLRNHIDLSSIADGKANMIISINTLVLSILLTAGAAGFSFSDMTINKTRYAIPILLLMLTSLTAIIFAVLSAIPKVSGADFNEEDIKNHEVSLLFFSNFLKVKKPVFVKYLRDLKKDQEVLYDDLSRDLYNLGAVLDKKYRLLTIAYRVFVGGLVLAFVVFLVLLFI